MTDEGFRKPVTSDEQLARFILHRNHLRQDWTVKPDAFIPHPWPDLSVTRHLQLSETDLWDIGRDVARRTGKTLHGRADVQALRFEWHRLRVVAVDQHVDVRPGVQAEMVKPHGFVLDFVGIFDKLEKALAFDSDEVNAIVKDLALLKQLFRAKMETRTPAYLALITWRFDDKDIDNLIEHFRDKERRKEFFKEYKEIEMLYEIISPDAFLRPFIEDYTTLSSIYAVVQNAYAKKVYVDKAFQRKTTDLAKPWLFIKSRVSFSTKFLRRVSSIMSASRLRHGAVRRCYDKNGTVELRTTEKKSNRGTCRAMGAGLKTRG